MWPQCKGDLTAGKSARSMKCGDAGLQEMLCADQGGIQQHFCLPTGDRMHTVLCQATLLPSLGMC